MKVYLYETSEESTKIFSLGAINPDITKNQKLLKIIVFQFIKNYNLINLKLTGESIWNFAKTYVRLAYENTQVNQSLINISVVRNLITGTFKSKLTSKSDDISLIKFLQDYLEIVITSKKFTKIDLETLTLLLGQKAKKLGSNNNNFNNNKQRSIIKQGNRNSSNSQMNSEFAEIFVTQYWIDLLEKLYNKGESIVSKECFQIALVSLISLPSNKISRLLSTLNINSKTSFIQLYPLIAKIVLSKKFNDMNPDLKEKIGFLNTQKSKPKAVACQFNKESINMITSVMPTITEGQAKQLLIDHNDNVEVAINILFETPPEVLASLKEYQDPTKVNNNKSLPKKKMNASKAVEESQKSRNSDEKDNDLLLDRSRMTFGKKERRYSFDKMTEEELKKKTLTNALRLLYESDEDEPDDTYDDQEKTSGSAVDIAPGTMSIAKEKRKNRKAKNSEIDTLGLEDLDIADSDYEDGETINKKMESEMDNIERELFDIYRSNPEQLSRTHRKKNERTKLKQETGWSDEQIEGWARMIDKTPSRFKMLEERFIFNSKELNGSLKKSSYRKPKAESDDDDDDDDCNDTPRRTGNGSSGGNNSGTANKKKQYSRNEKNKAKRANHNRKSGHDKKMAKQFN
ncbi:unnamed protein product [[Candida] boidinii]|uniref:Unnamed protein product n=1 Tax=Candida boidinii TaxID=5477 RepID=A0ACB5TRQ9_CANBO|nr:unnamed protein product [[Candida] boidinii]